MIYRTLIIRPPRGARFKRALMRHLPVTLKRGDPVIYRPEPGLYGLMTVYNVRLDGRIVCALLPADAELEVFEAHELEEITAETAPKC